MDIVPFTGRMGLEIELLEGELDPFSWVYCQVPGLAIINNIKAITVMNIVVININCM